MIPYSMKFAKKQNKKTKIKIKFQKVKGTFFEPHPPVEKSPTATDSHLDLSTF